MAGNVTDAAMDMNDDSVEGTILTLTTEVSITLMVVTKTGTHSNHHVGLKMSPNNATDWIPFKDVVRGQGYHEYSCKAPVKVKAFVEEKEGATSVADVYLFAV